MIDYTAFFLGALGFFVAPVVLALALLAGAIATSPAPSTGNINPATGIATVAGGSPTATIPCCVTSTLYGAASTGASAFLLNKFFKNDNILNSYSLLKAGAFLRSIFSFN
jgi:hypothetical protein